MLALGGAQVLSPAFPALANNLRTVDQPNQDKLAAFEAKRDWEGMARFAQQNLQVDGSHAAWGRVRPPPGGRSWATRIRSRRGTRKRPRASPKSCVSAPTRWTATTCSPSPTG